MKHFAISAISLLFAFSAFAGTNALSCRVAKMHYSPYFEEGLSEHEYPNVDYTAYRGQVLSIGCHEDITQANGGRFRILKQTPYEFVVQAQRAGSRDLIVLQTRFLVGKDGRIRKVGTLWVKEFPNKTFTRIASLICSR